MLDDVVARINALAKKAKTEGLTPEELEERAHLRRMYIDAYKADLIAQLENTYVVGPDHVKRKLKKKPGKPGPENS